MKKKKIIPANQRCSVKLQILTKYAHLHYLRFEPPTSSLTRTFFYYHTTVICDSIGYAIVSYYLWNLFVESGDAITHPYKSTSKLI